VQQRYLRWAGKLHIPAFRPDPLFLLGALTGEVNESRPALLQLGRKFPLKKRRISASTTQIHSTQVKLTLRIHPNWASIQVSFPGWHIISFDGQRKIAGAGCEGPSETKSRKGETGTGEFKLESEADLGDLDLGEDGEEELSLDSFDKGESIASQEAADSDLTLLWTDEDEAAGSESKDDLLTHVSAESSNSELSHWIWKLKRPQQRGNWTHPGRSQNRWHRGTGTRNWFQGLDLDKLLEMDEIKLDEIPITEAPPKSKREPRVVNAAAPKRCGSEKLQTTNFLSNWMTWIWN